MRRVFRPVSVLIEYSKPRRTLMFTAVLVAVKAKLPWRAREVRGLDSHSARRWLRCAGRDGRNGLPQGPNKRMRSEAEDQPWSLGGCLLSFQANPVPSALGRQWRKSPFAGQCCIVG